MALGVLAAALVGAFVIAPGRLAADGASGDLADHHHFVEVLHSAFIEYWRSGDRDLSPDLARVVDYWFRYHVAKAVIAAVLLIVLVALTVLVWKAFLKAGGLGAVTRAALASAGALAAMLALLSLAAVMANIQGALAPFSSLTPMLTEGAADQEFATTLGQVRQRLADSSPSGARTPPAIDVMIADFSRYHAVMAVVAVIVAASLLGTSVLLWRRFARTASSDRRTRRVVGAFGLLSALLTLGLIVHAAANAATAADRGPALLNALKGGW
ncbi:hypothetical protein [Parafrankia discariae]|uniref:hypothetical protein n=1 Tax=Parafrankia discariae TaxID=365528 RepID=UPI000370D093|nr:hypothetical protein [Parafrankia discariae]